MMNPNTLPLSPNRSFRNGPTAFAVAVSIMSGALVAFDRLDLAAGCVVLMAAAFLASSPKRLLIYVAGIWAIFWVPWVPSGIFLAIKDVVLLAFLVFALALWLFKDRRVFSPLFQTPVSGLLVLLLLTLIPGVFFSDQILSSMGVWLRFAAAAVIYAALLYLFRSRPTFIDRIFKLLVLSVALSAVQVILVQTGILPPLQPPADFVGDPGLMGFSYRPIGLSWAIAFVMPIAVAFLVRDVRDRRISALFWAPVSIALGIACAMTKGRGGLLAAFLGTAVVLWTMHKGWRGKALVLAFAAASVLFLVLNPSFVESNLLRGLYSVDQVTTGSLPTEMVHRLASGRLGIWSVGLDHIQDSPLLGVGLGQFSARLAQPILGVGRHTHNLFLAAAVEGGLFAGLAAVLLFLYILNFYRPSAAGLAGGPHGHLAAACYGVIVASLVSTVVEIGPMFHSLYLGLPFWFALAAVDGLKRCGE
jgi:O-antigen ligase